MKAVHFGAGNIGRGFIGKVLHDNGYSVTFADVNADIIEALNQDQSYTVHIAEENGASYTIDDVAGINTAQNPGALKEAIMEADIITTAVGVNILPVIANAIAPHLKARTATGRPLNIIACENAVMATDALKEAILDTTGSINPDVVSFPNSAVDRIVPMQTNDNILDVKVEPFFEWVIEESAWAGTDKLEDVTYVPDLMPYIERKLFTVNTGHAAIAYYGRTLGLDTVSEAMEDEKVESFLRDVLSETAVYLTEVYDFSRAEQDEYIEKIIGRFKNVHLSDDLNRVGRGVLRKLGPDDRIIKPLTWLHEHGLKHDALARLVSFALQFDNTEDPEQIRMNTLIRESGIAAFLKKHSRLSEKLIREII